MFEKNRFAKVMVYIGIAFWAAYLVLFGVLLPSAFSEGFPGMEPYHILNKGLLIVLALDFLVRFLFPTPIQEVKPFLLLPIPKRKIMTVLLMREAVNPFNLFWLFLFVPFALLSVTRFYGLAGILGYAVGVWLLTVMNSYWSMLIRVLKRQKFAYICWCLPVYGILALLEFLPGTHWVSTFTMNWGEGFILWNPLAFLGALAGIGLMGFINYKVQLHLIYSELSRVEDTKLKKISDYSFLDRYGNVGEYMRLELKLMLRNKICRKSLITIVCAVAVISAVIGFTDIYDGALSEFWVLYNYVIVVLLSFSTLMGYEGNYMDGLMTRRESIFALLRAKYALYTSALIVPFLLMLPGVVTGKQTLLQSVSWLLFTAGPISFCFFQVAVYNNRTVDLNAKMTARSNQGTGLQQIMAFAAFLMPFVVYLPLLLAFGETVGRWALIALGLGFILTSRLWIRNVYRRLMQRRYQNMEGFRDSRQR